MLVELLIVLPVAVQVVLPVAVQVAIPVDRSDVPESFPDFYFLNFRRRRRLFFSPSSDY